jgi:hypothetical protein
MVYDAPVLQEVGQATQLVLGFQVAGSEGAGSGNTRAFDFVLGLDD